jgi:hypothetical protein
MGQIMLILPWRRAGLATALIVVTAVGAIAAVRDRPATHPAGPTMVEPAAQGGGATCPPGQRECQVQDEEGGADQGGGGDGGDNGGGGGACTFDTGGGLVTVSDDRGGAVEVVLVAQTGEVEVPCYMDGYGWYSGGCYYGDFPDAVDVPAPPEGRTEQDGRHYWESCLMSVLGELPNQAYIWQADMRWVWFDFADVPTVSPEELARRAIAAIGLDPLEFRLAPPTTGAGLVGLPVWLGIAETPNTWGPISGGPECDGDLCVSIRAEVTRVDWDMGDGTVITCGRNDHRVWRPGLDFLSPPGCHHYYDRASRDQPDGRYPISATSHWTVTWRTTSGGGETGTIPAPRTASTSLRINEIQVLTSE